MTKCYSNYDCQKPTSKQLAYFVQFN